MLILVIMLLGSMLFLLGATVFEHGMHARKACEYRYLVVRNSAHNDAARMRKELEREKS